MKNIWKWLFFTLLVIVVLAILGMFSNFNMMTGYNGYGSGSMMSPFGGRTFGYHDFNGMRGGYSSFPFVAIPFMLLGFGFRLLPLIFFGLIVWGIYRLGVSSGRNQNSNSRTAEPIQPAAPATTPSENEQEVEIK